MRTVKSPVGMSMVLAAVCSTSAHAHHSFAMFDNKQCLDVAGTVKQFQFSYPHSWIWLVVPDAAGADNVFAFEGTDPASLRVRGWTQDSVHVGDKITLRYRPLKDGRKGGSFLRVIKGDGQALKTDEEACELTAPEVAKP